METADSKNIAGVSAPQERLNKVIAAIRDGALSSETLATELFASVSDLDSIPKKARTRLCSQLKLKELRHGAVLIPDKEKVAEFYVVAQGALQFVPSGLSPNIHRTVRRWRKLHIASKKETKKEEEVSPESDFDPTNVFNAGSLVGDLSAITQKKWKAGTVFALEDSVVIVFSVSNVAKIIREESSRAEFQELLAFVCDTFPKFKTINSSGQRKILDCFKLRVFYPGQYLIREGEIGVEAFLIKEGECSLQSRKSPLYGAGTEESKVVDTLLKPKRGFLSDTINRFQFGILEKNQWAGEERLLKESEEPFDYSVVAMSKVAAYSVSKYEAEERLPQELRSFLKNAVSERSKWIEQRTESLASATRMVANMDPSFEKYDERLNDLMKKYPAALPHALKSIRKLQLITKMREKRSPELTVRHSPMARLPLMECSLSPRLQNSGAASPISNTCPNKSSFELNSFPRGLNPSRPKMNNATSMSKMVLTHGLVPIMNKVGSKRQLSKLAKIGLTSMVDNEGSNSLAHFVIGAREIGLKQEVEELKPVTPNPYFAINKQIGNRSQNH